MSSSKLSVESEDEDFAGEHISASASSEFAGLTEIALSGKTHVALLCLQQSVSAASNH